MMMSGEVLGEGQQQCSGALLGGNASISSVYWPLVAGLLLFYVVVDKLCSVHFFYHVRLWLECLLHPLRRIDDNVVSMPPIPNQDDPAAADTSILEKDGGGIACFDPCTNQRLSDIAIPAMTATQVHEACERAAAAQVEWRKTSFAQRRAVLRTLQAFVVERAEEICTVCTLDSGKPALDAMLGEVLTTCEKIRCICSQGELWLRPSPRNTGPILMHKIATVEYVPLGVIATIAPWNYPFHNMMNHIISGIFAGNAVVGKVSEHTTWSAHAYFDRIVAAALEAHGHDPNLVQTVTGFGEAGAALVADPLVDKVIFTGSPEIGRKVMSTAAEHLKPVVLELGGKDALVVMDDCKVDEVLPFVMRGCFQNGGQNCVGVERVLVYESVYDEFVTKIVPKVQALRQGRPPLLAAAAKEGEGCRQVDCGALVVPEQVDKIQALVDDAVASGAKILVGGGGGGGGCDAPSKNSSNGNGGGNGGGKGNKGNFYPPTVLVNVTRDMSIFQNEVFGPVMTVVKVPQDSDDVCLELLNGTAFGLGCNVFGGNPQRALALGRRVRSGMLCVNDFASNYLVQSLPFGGVKESGFGRFAGPEGLRALCLERSILTDRFPKSIKTTIPKVMDYPVPDDEGAAMFGNALVRFFYDERYLEKIKAIVKLIKYG